MVHFNKTVCTKSTRRYNVGDSLNFTELPVRRVLSCLPDKMSTARCLSSSARMLFSIAASKDSWIDLRSETLDFAPSVSAAACLRTDSRISCMFGLEIKNPSRSPRKETRLSHTVRIMFSIMWCGVVRCGVLRCVAKDRGKFAQYAVYLSLPMEFLFLSLAVPLFCSVSRIFLADSSDTHLQ
jgi:hypothetical protein